MLSTINIQGVFKVKKGMLTVIVGILISILTIPVLYAYAESSTYTDSTDFVINTLDSSTAEITEYIGTDKQVIIPEQIDGLIITKIGKAAFNNTEIESVVLPETIEKIDKYAFNDCAQLKSIKFTGNESVIDNTAFINVGSDTETLTQIVVPNSWKKSDMPTDSKTPWHGGYFNTSIYSSEKLAGTSTKADCIKPVLIISVSAVIMFIGTAVVIATVIRREKNQHSEAD